MGIEPNCQRLFLCYTESMDAVGMQDVQMELLYGVRHDLRYKIG